MTMRKEVEEIRPGLSWILDPDLREKTLQAGVRAFDRSPRKAQHLREIPLRLHVEGCKVSWLAQEGMVEILAPNSALKIAKHTCDDRTVDQDTLITN